MRIAIVHSFYRSENPSGENRAVDAQFALLASAGFEVAVIEARSDDAIAGPFGPLKAAGRVTTGLGGSPLDRLRDFKPDVVHVHNLFPNIGTAWLAGYNGPLIATVHNFRAVCASATLWRQGGLCTLCPERGSRHAVKHRCYRGSALATLPLAISQRGGPNADPLLSRADAVIALTPVVQEMFSRWRSDIHKWRVLPNFVPDADASTPGVGDGPWLYAGRFSDEKGVIPLLERWPDSEPLELAGSGPLLSVARSLGTDSTSWLGVLDQAALRKKMRSARGLIFPSGCLEGGYALTVVEALAAGCPVIAREGNVVGQLVKTGAAGATIPDQANSYDIASALNAVATDNVAMRARARNLYLEHFTPARWLDQYMQVLTDVTSESAGSR